MEYEFFIKLNLEKGDNVWLINEKGEGFGGTIEETIDIKNMSFKFNNFSNGKIETIEIKNIQSITINNKLNE